MEEIKRGRKAGDKYINAADAFIKLVNKQLENWLKEPNHYIGFDTITKVEEICSTSKPPIPVPKFLVDIKSNKSGPVRKKYVPTLGTIIERDVFLNRGNQHTISMIPVPHDIYKCDAGTSVKIMYEKDKIIISF